MWTGAAGTPAQPVAILVEAAEATWRERMVPVRQGDEFRYGSQRWLEIVDAGEAQVVNRLVWTSDGASTLAILHPNVRGKRVVLLLKRNHHPLYEGDTTSPPATVADVVLTPPWEADP
jgi:hypothetical protein